MVTEVKSREYWEEPMTQAEIEDYDRLVTAGYLQSVEDIRGFVGYLDRMPRKRLIHQMFWDPRTGDVCAVAAFCLYKGFNRLNMLLVERASRRQRRAKSYEATTANAGVAAGLAFDVARDLVYLSDEVYWDMTAESRWCAVREYLASKVVFAEAVDARLF